MDKCYFSVAHPDFETSRHIDITLVIYYSEYVCNLLNLLSIFWKNHIYRLMTLSPCIRKIAIILV